MIKPKTNTPKDVNKFVRNLLLSIYADVFPNFKIPCVRVYSESYNEGKSWRYKWYFLGDRTKRDVYEKMTDFTNEVLKPRMEALFEVSVSMKYQNESLTLLAKPVK